MERDDPKTLQGAMTIPVQHKNTYALATFNLCGDMTALIGPRMEIGDS